MPPRLPSRRWPPIVGRAAVGLALAGLGSASAACTTNPSPPPPPPPASPSTQITFADQLSNFNSDRFMRADGWKCGSPFDCGWRGDHVQLDGDLMTLKLDDTPTQGFPYASGEYRTKGFYGHGCYEVSFKPVAVSGVVSSFFTFAGPYDNGGNGRHNEIDIEFLGYDTTRMQANFWTNDDAYANGHEVLLELGFDASRELHVYGFKWTGDGIEWWVDGVLLYAVENSQTDPTPDENESLHKMFLNLWPVDATAFGWAGKFMYPGAPLRSHYDWLRYTSGDACSMTTPPPPPTPIGDPSAMHVSWLTMSLRSQGAQASAQVTILDGNQRPVSGVTVTGQWSGIVTGGDTSRVTGPDGSALFYSNSTPLLGAFLFCVGSAAKLGMTYDDDANLETCDAISR